MFSITPIGSCRITTPLRRGQSMFGTKLNLDRCYGYCHSPAEAVQMAEFMLGNATIPEHIWPLVSRAHDHHEISNARHALSDLYVVELASAKEVTIDGISVQLNYLKSEFSDFFENADRAVAFWSLAETGDENAIADFLQHEWSETERQRADSKVLVNIKRQFVTRESLRRDIARLTGLLPDVLFVSHVDAQKTDGNTIKSRTDFIRLVEEEVTAAGCKFFNPTDLMNEVGQAAAIEDESTGLAHFTDSFADKLMGRWVRDFVAPSTDVQVRLKTPGAVDYKLKPQIDVACRQNRFADVRARLSTLVAEDPELSALYDNCLSRQTTAQTAFLETLGNGYADRLGADQAQQCVLDACKLGLFDTALDLVGRYPSVFAEMSLHDVLECASMASKSNALNASVEFLLAGVISGDNGARRDLADLALAQKIDILSMLEVDERASLLECLPPRDRLQLLRLNGASFVQAVTSATSPQDVLEIITELSVHDGIGYAAEVLGSWRELCGTDRVTDAGLKLVLDDWVETALSSDEVIERIHGLNAVLFAAPRHSSARNAMRDTRKELALRIRAAGHAGDIETLDALTVEANALTSDLPELDLWRARLRFSAGEFETAMELGQSAAELLPEKINVWVLLMRSALKLGDSINASAFAERVIDLTSPDTEKLKLEAQAVLNSDLVGA